jgi:hypothetical protein
VSSTDDRSIPAISGSSAILSEIDTWSRPTSTSAIVGRISCAAADPIVIAKTIDIRTYRQQERARKGKDT